jgi:hypothetical protein
MKTTRNFHPTTTSTVLQKTARSAAVILIALCLGAQSYAGFNQFSVGLNFGSDNANNGTGARALNPTDVAGLPAVAQANWNNMPGLTGNSSGGAVVDNNGTATAAGVTWVSALGTWSSGANNQFASVPDHTLMMGYLDNATTATVNITNLPSQLTANGYDVYVYALYDTANRGGTYSIVDGLNTSTVLKPAQPFNADTTPTNYVQCPGANTSQSGNYLVFHGLTSANIQVVAVANHGDLLRAVIGGIQLVAAPAPGEALPPTGLRAATNGLTGQLVISWTNDPTAQGNLVVMRRGIQVTAEPVDGQTYAGDATFGNGTNLGDDEIGAGNFVVFSGPTNGIKDSVTVSNLTPTLTYYVAVYPYIGSGASIDYTLAGPAATNAVAAGTMTNILLAAPSPVVVGSARHYTVSALYDNGSTSDLTPAATCISSNSSIVTNMSAGRLGALAAGGPVGFKAIYTNSPGQVFTNIQLVTVLNLAMTYEWSFNDPVANLTVTDTVAGAVGYVSNNPTTGPDGAGKLVFDGTAGYVALPANLVSSYGALTIETWATETTAATWERVWDFGSGQTVNMFMTPNGGGGVLRAAFTVSGGGNETRVNSLFNPDTALHHYVFTLAGATRTGKLFLDGVQVGVNNSFGLTPEDLGPMANVYLGKSQYPDPYFTGTMDEFRVYNGALDPFQIAVDASTGPDVIVTTNNVGALTNLTITAASPMTQFGVEPATVLGYFANLANPANISTSPQTKYFSKDPNIASVDALGQITGNSGGTVLIVATNTLGGSNAVSITVVPIPPGLTHRYNMNLDANDSFGTAHGTPHGSISFDGTKAIFDGGGITSGNINASYIELPPNLMLGYSSIAIEMWYTDTDPALANSGWSRIFDFGAGTASYLFLTPLVGANPPAYPNNMRTAFLLAGQTGGEEQINIPRPSPNVEHHLVFTIDGSTLRARLYVDGLLQLERNGTRQPRDMGPTPNDWLGRSQFAGDFLFKGSINELRLYNGILTPLQVYMDYLAGPDVVTNGGAISGVGMTLTNMPSQSLQQARILANFAFSNAVPVMSGSSNWASSDATVAQVNSDGLITSIKAGVASISATFNGTTVSSNLTVSAAPPVLAHRYSFDADATDSIAGSNGVNAGSAVFTGGRVALDGTANSYVTLPGHLFDGFKEVTFETWTTVSNANATGGNFRLWDFGDHTITNYLFFTPSSPGNTTARWNFDFNPFNGALEEISLARNFNLVNNGTNLNHYVWVFSDILGRADLYLNGVFADTFPYSWLLQSPTLSRLVNSEGYIGHASRTNAPPGSAAGTNFMGAVDEFRIWNGALTRLQIETSFASGPTNVLLNPGAPSSISLTLNDPTMVLGTIQRPVVKGTFATVGTLDLTGVPDVVLTSSDSTKVVVIGGGDAKLRAVGTGTANVVASYGGLSATSQVTVISVPALRIAHRYSFRGTAADSVGHADGTLKGQAAIINNALVLNGVNNPATHLQLPSDLIDGYDKATIEAWGTTGNNTGGSQQRLFDIGNRFNGAGFNYFYYTPGNVGRVGLPGQQGEFQLNSGAFPNSSRYNVVITVDSANGILGVYTNGLLSLTLTNRAVNLSLINDVYTFLGRSQFGDPPLNGTIDEFRLYSGVITAGQIAASYAAGPDPENLTATPGPGAGNVTISWPAVPVLDGYSPQFATSLNPSNWQPAGAPTQVGGNYQLTVAAGGTAKFFRLIK